MVILRGCPKCEGDLYIEENIDGTDLVCLQCGHRPVFSPRPSAEVSAPERRTKRVERHAHRIRNNAPIG